MNINCFAVKKSIKRIMCILVGLLVSACAQEPGYQFSESSKQIKQVQILDPGAPERNDGIVAALEGNYGKSVLRKYNRSAYDAKSGRQLKQSSQ